MPETDSKLDFLGTGWSFPFRINADGRIAMAAFEEDVRQAIRIILGTHAGERMMRPDFGGGLNTFVFEPVNSATMVLVKTRVEEALLDWEPRIDVDEVRVTANPADRSQLLIDVRYRVRATNSLHNLVFPFYLDEGASP